MTRCIWPGGRPSLCITSRSTGKASEAIRPSAWCRRRSSVRKVSWNHGAWHVAGIVTCWCPPRWREQNMTKRQMTGEVPRAQGTWLSGTKSFCHWNTQKLPPRLYLRWSGTFQGGWGPKPGTSRNSQPPQKCHEVSRFSRKHLEVSYNFGNPKSSKSVDHFRWFEDIEAHGDLGIPHFKKPPRGGHRSAAPRDCWDVPILEVPRKVLSACALEQGCCKRKRTANRKSSICDDLCMEMTWNSDKFVYGNHRNPSGFRIKTTKRGTATHGSRGSPFHWAGATEVGRAREDVHPPRHPPKLGLSRWDHLAPARSMSIFDVFLSLMYKICTYIYIYIYIINIYIINIYISLYVCVQMKSCMYVYIYIWCKYVYSYAYCICAYMTYKQGQYLPHYQCFEMQFLILPPPCLCTRYMTNSAAL